MFQFEFVFLCLFLENLIRKHEFLIYCKCGKHCDMLHTLSIECWKCSNKLYISYVVLFTEELL